MKKNNVKRIAALGAVILIVGLYVAAFILSLLDVPGSKETFRVCLIATIAIPLLTWIYIWLYGQITGKRTIADLNLMQSPEDVRRAAAEEKPQGGETESDEPETAEESADTETAEPESTESAEREEPKEK